MKLHVKSFKKWAGFAQTQQIWLYRVHKLKQLGHVSAGGVHTVICTVVVKRSVYVTVDYYTNPSYLDKLQRDG